MPMKSEDAPITDDEWLLRRVWKDRFRTQKVPIVSIGAFEPRCKGADIDTDGISLYREACLKRPDDILALVAEDKRNNNAVVRVSVAFVKGLELTVEPKPVPHIKGHVVLPELNAIDYGADPTAFRPDMLALAEEASKD
jgi:hypothetical protein